MASSQGPPQDIGSSSHEHLRVSASHVFLCLSVPGRAQIMEHELRTCRVPGCTETTTKFGAYCSTHKAVMRRHGDPRQEGVTKAQLEPYVKLVEARIAKNTANPVWSQLDDRWQVLTQSAGAILSAYHNGRPGLRHEVRAASEISKLSQNVEPRKIIVAALAMYVMLDQEPRRFRSDAAFSTQLVRRVRGLSDVNVGEWYDDKSGRTRRVYRELPPRVVEVIRGWLIAVLGPVGIKLAALEREEQEARQREALSFQQAVQNLA